MDIKRLVLISSASDTGFFDCDCYKTFSEAGKGNPAHQFINSLACIRAYLSYSYSFVCISLVLLNLFCTVVVDKVNILSDRIDISYEREESLMYYDQGFKKNQ